MKKLALLAVGGWLIGGIPAPATAQEPSCEQRLQVCEANLAAAEDRIRSLGIAFEDLYAEWSSLLGIRDAYERLTADADGDGVPDGVDLCAATGTGLEIDLGGCSLGQLCGASPVASRRERTICRRLDWKNDEPAAMAPGDCKVDRAAEQCVAAVAEPMAPAGCPGTLVTISTQFDAPVAGISVFVSYPPDLIALPGSGSEVLSRVEFLVGDSGLLGAVDSDTDGDGKDDRLGVGVIRSFTEIPSGPFVRVHFDCVPDSARVPTREDFTCLAEAANQIGQDVPASCTVEVMPAS